MNADTYRKWIKFIDDGGDFLDVKTLGPTKKITSAIAALKIQDNFETSISAETIRTFLHSIGVHTYICRGMPKLTEAH